MFMGSFPYGSTTELVITNYINYTNNYSNNYINNCIIYNNYINNSYINNYCLLPGQF